MEERSDGTQMAEKLRSKTQAEVELSGIAPTEEWSWEDSIAGHHIIDCMFETDAEEDRTI